MNWPGSGSTLDHFMASSGVTSENWLPRTPEYCGSSASPWSLAAEPISRPCRAAIDRNVVGAGSAQVGAGDGPAATHATATGAGGVDDAADPRVTSTRVPAMI